MRMEMEQVKRTHEVLPEQMPSGTQACLAHSVKSMEHFEEKSALDNGSTYEQDALGCTCNIGMKYVSLFDGIVDVDKSLVTWLRDVEVQCKHQKNRNAMAASLFEDKRISWMVTRTDEEQAMSLPGNGNQGDLDVAKLVEHQKKNVRQIGKGANHIIACYKFRRKYLMATAYLERNFVSGLYSQFIKMHLMGKVKAAVEADGMAEEDYCSMDHIGKYPSYMYAGTVVLEKGDCGMDRARLKVIQASQWAPIKVTSDLQQL
ncbi:hypothetical protein GUITHDRAFT_116005 [Guillardia theta CCMP2712]|uniref:Uncharacterized protein n=1 Tax=Guillardia theta (strain CCMP2712) TaxID=905079 RepID=L1INN3_GUITC|nr:hypothetical protein GUITHDRAFT_116005 [Guillardia theta CCMP2712]EKX37863.1 hypothetical protein GUITHDRAFT_116005 [Guillardia theta CCMP2712]|eukprot:XP_005824843.1 hypothetical protein GUITHDRAFT_116005 [Guillardia theta CCMP2712]